MKSVSHADQRNDYDVALESVSIFGNAINLSSFRVWRSRSDKIESQSFHKLPRRQKIGMQDDQKNIFSKRANTKMLSTTYSLHFTTIICQLIVILIVCDDGEEKEDVAKCLYLNTHLYLYLYLYLSEEEKEDVANCLYLNIQIRSNATESFAPLSLRLGQ